MKRPVDPFADAPKGLRTRARADGSRRVWWEPTPSQRKLGLAPVELDEDRPTWSRRQAEDLNRDAARRMKGTAVRDGRRTVEALAETYLRSTTFRDLRARTQADYRPLCRRVVERMGHRLVRDVTKPQLHDWYEELRGQTGVRMSQALIRMASILFSHAELIGWRDENTNPAFRLKLKQPDRRDRVGTWEELDALLVAADSLGMPGLGLAIGISALSGQRSGDVLALTADQFVTLDGPTGPVTIMRLVRSKRQTAGVLPVHPEAAPRLRLALAAAGPESDAPVVTRADGTPYTANTFPKDWSTARALAAKVCPSVATLKFLDLRRTFGALSRAGGTSKDDVAAVLGNTADTNFALGMTYMPPELAETARAVAGVRRTS